VIVATAWDDALAILLAPCGRLLADQLRLDAHQAELQAMKQQHHFRTMKVRADVPNDQATRAERQGGCCTRPQAEPAVCIAVGPGAVSLTP
jgi:hypothetical protein